MSEHKFDTVSTADFEKVEKLVQSGKISEEAIRTMDSVEAGVAYWLMKKHDQKELLDCALDVVKNSIPEGERPKFSKQDIMLLICEIGLWYACELRDDVDIKLMCWRHQVYSRARVPGF